MMENKETNTPETPENPTTWEKKNKIGLSDQITPIINALLLVIEEEKKRTLMQMTNAKKLLENMRANR